jgi:hypothetical protein
MHITKVMVRTLTTWTHEKTPYYHNNWQAKKCETKTLTTLHKTNRNTLLKTKHKLKT